MTTATVRDGHTLYQLTSGTAYRIARIVARNIDLEGVAVEHPEKWAGYYGHQESRWIAFQARVFNNYGIGPMAIFASVMGHQIEHLLESQNGAVVRYRSQNLYEDSIDADYTVGDWKRI
jgi:hypothetical protein